MLAHSTKKAAPLKAKGRRAKVSNPPKHAPRLAVRGQLGETVASSPIARLTDPAISRQLDKELDAMRADPERARRFLVDLGVITPKTGKLTRRFGG